LKLDGLGRGWLFFKTEEKKEHLNKQNKRAEIATRAIQNCAIKNIFTRDSQKIVLSDISSC